MEKTEFHTAVYDVIIVKKASILREAQDIRHSRDAATLVSNFLRGSDREHFVGLYLDAAHRPIGLHTIAIGTINSVLVHPREVFKPAILLGAVAVIVAHNHPSGRLTPSARDREMTTDLVSAGKILGIPLRDHIIMTEDKGFLSFAMRGLL